MTPDIAQAFEHAEQARREGRFEAARALYQTILKGLQIWCDGLCGVARWALTHFCLMRLQGSIFCGDRSIDSVRISLGKGRRLCLKCLMQPGQCEQLPFESRGNIICRISHLRALCCVMSHTGVPMALKEGFLRRE